MVISDFNAKMRSLFVLIVMLLCGVAVSAQDGSVSGVVKDQTGEPAIGATIQVKGTTHGTITDYDGNFTLDVPSDAVLVVSYMGFKTQEITVGSQRSFNITLVEDAELLDDVVVIGYGVVKKDDATGSVTAIEPDMMNKGLTTNAQDMMQGKIAGVNVTTAGGDPGAGAAIRIRGGSSLSASNDPLIVIDGLAMDNNGIQGVSNPLAMVNPNDIETFTVLKDASATAIYGSRASNGVIIITTKKGRAGQKPTFSYEGNMSASVLTNRMEVMNTSEYRDWLTNNGFSSQANGLGAGKGHEGDPQGLADFLVGCNGVANTLAVGNKIQESTDEYVTVRMEGKCALVQGWEKMGLSPEEVEYLCDIASYGDYGHANALDLQGTWECTSAQKNCDYCDFKIEKLKEKTIV